MTTRPQLKLGSHLLPGLVAVALFVAMAVTFLSASFPAPQGFPEDGGITASIGYAMFNIDQGTVPSEGFLVAFEIIDVVLVAALAGAVLLARREEGSSLVTALTDGGRELRRAVASGGDRDDDTDDLSDERPNTDDPDADRADAARLDAGGVIDDGGER